MVEPSATTNPLADDIDIESPSGRAVALPRTLGVRDLVLFNLVAILGLRWTATAAKSGPSAITLWLLAAALFFIPQGLAVAELSARYPAEGGIYVWTKQRFGEGHAYLCGWCYWIVNVLYYPQLLLSTAVIATYIVGKGSSGLEHQWTYVLPMTLAALWIAVAVNIVGLRTGKWLQNVGGVGSYVTGAILILVGVAAVFTFRPANTFTWQSMRPSFASLPTVSLWASIAFAFAGMELGATLGGEIRDARRALPRAVYLTTPLVAGIYILGTGAVLWLVPTNSVNILTGFLQGIDVGAARFGHWLWWLAPLAAAAYTVGNIGGVGAWLSGPARVAFVIGLDRYFPPVFGRVHPRWGTPYVAILVQAVLASVLLLLSQLGKGTTVEGFYLILLNAQLLIYFIPFIYLFLCFLVEPIRPGGLPTVVPGGAPGKFVLAMAGLGVTLFAMAVTAIPGPDAESVLSYELQVVGGALAFILVGGIFYWRASRQAAARNRTAKRAA
jgi:amino acid transporter